jgi:hypothetical protein
VAGRASSGSAESSGRVVARRFMEGVEGWRARVGGVSVMGVWRLRVFKSTVSRKAMAASCRVRSGVGEGGYEVG